MSDPPVLTLRKPRLTYLGGMAVRRHPHRRADLQVLKRIPSPSRGVDDDLRALMDDMLETMYAAPGIGLAAIQVGVPKRVIVMDLARGEEPREPALLRQSGDPLGARRRPSPTRKAACRCRRSTTRSSGRRGCKLRYLNYHGEPVEEDAEGLFAVCIQHEIDHLDGVLFIDHLSRLKRDRAIAQVRKAQAEEAASRTQAPAAVAVRGMVAALAGHR